MEIVETALQNLSESTGIKAEIEVDPLFMRHFGADTVIRFHSMGIEKLFRVMKHSEVHDLSTLIASTSIRLDQSNIADSIIIANYVSPKMKELLVSRGIHYLETAGNCHIQADGLFLHIDGKKTLPYRQSDKNLAFSTTGMKVILALLVSPKLAGRSYRELASAANVALGSIGKVLQDLEQLEYLQTVGGRRVLNRPEELLNHWLDNYQSTLFEDNFLGRYTLKDGMLPDQCIVSGVADQTTGIGRVLYTDLLPSQFESKFGLERDEAGDVFVLKRFWGDGELIATENQVNPLLNFADWFSMLSFGDFTEEQQEIINEAIHIWTTKLKDQIKKELDAEMAEAKALERNHPEPLWDKRRAAKELGVSPGTVDNLRRRGQLKSIYVGRRVLFNPEEVQKLINR